MVARVLSLVLTCFLLSSCTLDVSDVEDASVGVTQQELGTSPDTSCQFFSSAGRDYWFCAPLRSWQNARSSCQAINLDLVSIGSATGMPQLLLNS
jgi:hypothetical protein